VAHLALSDEVFDGAGDIRDRYVGVDAVLVEGGDGGEGLEAPRDSMMVVTAARRLYALKEQPLCAACSPGARG
jgi:hypothetical protein